MLQPRKIDSKGRVMLGSEFAGAIVLVEHTDNGDIIIHPAMVVPKHEAWVHNNPEVASDLARALDQASKKQFASNPIDINNEDWLDNEG